MQETRQRWLLVKLAWGKELPLRQWRRLHIAWTGREHEDPAACKDLYDAMQRATEEGLVVGAGVSTVGGYEPGWRLRMESPTNYQEAIDMVTALKRWFIEDDARARLTHNRRRAMPEAKAKDHVTLELRFESEEDREEWFGRYVDGGGEQAIECYANEWDEDFAWVNIRVDPL